jgi:cyclase
MQRISNQVYVESGFQGCNCGLVVTEEGPVLIDTPMIPVQAMQWRDTVACYGPVRYIINTEPHGDHFTGNYYLGGTVIAHEGTRATILKADTVFLKKMLMERNPGGPGLDEKFQYRPPTLTFSENMTLHFKNLTLKLIHMPGHTPFQTCVYIPEEKIAFTSDNVVKGMLPFMHEAQPYLWLEAIQKLRELEVEIYVPGHGLPCDKSYLSTMTDTINAWINAVKNALNKGWSLTEAQQKISFLDQFKSPEGKKMMEDVQNRNIAHLYEILK